MSSAAIQLQPTSAPEFNDRHSTTTKDIAPNYIPEPLSELTESTLSYAQTKKVEDIFQPLRKYSPPIRHQLSRPHQNATPLERWEGRILDVDYESESMSVILDSLTGNNPSHTAEIPLQYVSDQDKPLLKSGAVFYLTLFMLRTRGGSIQNSQELRFRRLPNWSEEQVEAIHIEAKNLLSKIKNQSIEK